MENKGFWIPIELMDLDISWTKRILMSEISQLEMLDAGCVASNAHFAEKLKLTTRAVSKALNELVKEELIILDNTNTKRNFGRKITTHSSSSTTHSSSDTIHSSRESKDSKPSKSSFSYIDDGKKECGDVSDEYILYVFEEIWKQQYKAIKKFTDRDGVGKKGETKIAFKAMWKRIGKISTIEADEFANYISDTLSSAYIKKEGVYYIPNLSTAIPNIETEIEIGLEEEDEH